MSMISEFVKELREKSALFSKSDFAVAGIAKDYKEAADIIEELSAKLASANKERSEKYYKGNNEFVEKLIGRLEEKFKYNSEQAEIYRSGSDKDAYFREKEDLYRDRANTYGEVMRIVNQLAEEYNQENDDTDYANIELYAFWQKHQWIPCSEMLPDVETEVLILARRKYTGGKIIPIITTAIYEDGTVLENDSIWHWYDLDGEWNEEEDCYIIPEGWWECRHYNMDEVYNNAIDDKVVAWQPLPEPYKGE